MYKWLYSHKCTSVIQICYSEQSLRGILHTEKHHSMLHNLKTQSCRLKSLIQASAVLFSQHGMHFKH